MRRRSALHPAVSVDYIAIVDPERSRPSTRAAAGTIVAVAARVGRHPAARQSRPRHGVSLNLIDAAPFARRRQDCGRRSPAWAVVSAERLAHIERVAELVLDWAEEMGVPDSERNRWLRAVWLHDALRDATSRGAGALGSDLPGRRSCGMVRPARRGPRPRARPIAACSTRCATTASGSPNGTWWAGCSTAPTIWSRAGARARAAGGAGGALPRGSERRASRGGAGPGRSPGAVRLAASRSDGALLEQSLRTRRAPDRRRSYSALIAARRPGSAPSPGPAWPVTPSRFRRPMIASWWRC